MQEEDCHTTLLGKRSRNFSTVQTALLEYYFENGMRGVGRRYSAIINHAASETHLSIDQVKVIQLSQHCSYVIKIMLV